MNNLLSRIPALAPRVRAGLVLALGRFPWMLLCGLGATVAGIVAARADAKDDLVDMCRVVAMTAALGMPLFFSLRMLRERVKGWSRIPVELAGVLALAAWFIATPHRREEMPGIVFISWLLLLAALHLFAAVSAYAQGEAGNGFWQFNRRIFLRFWLATLFTGVLTGGLELALLSASKLFDLDLDRSYWNLFCAMGGCFHPVFFLAGVPRDFEALKGDAEYPRGLRAFTQFVLATLVAAYTAILYAYAFKIVAGRTWPHGWVALPVLILSVVGILAALLLHPLRARPEEKWAGWYCRNFPRALGPLSLLLLLSVWRRIRDYGVTEERYLGIVAGAWILTWSAVFIFKRAPGIRWIPVSLSIICLLAALGPWSAGGISERSQLRRLTEALEAYGLVADGKAQATGKGVALPSTDYDDLSSMIRYLVSMHGGTTVQGLFGELLAKVDWKKISEWDAQSSILDKLKITDVSNTDTGETTCSFTLVQDNVQALEGFKRLSYYQSNYNGDWKLSKGKCGDIYIGVKNGTLETASDEKAPPEPVALDALLKSLQGKDGDTLPPERLSVDFERYGHDYRIVFATLYLFRKPGEIGTIDSCSFMLLEK